MDVFTGRGKKIMLISICCWQLTAAAAAQGSMQLAAYWAPTVDQFFKTAGNSSQFSPAQEDTSTVFNFDLDWRANNNWENLNYYKLKPPMVYYSVAETEKYSYLGYYFYYPRHLGANPHGNDFSGLLVVVEKIAATGTGRLAGLLLYDDGGWQEINISRLRTVDNPVQVTISAGEHAIALRKETSPLPANVLTLEPQKSGPNVTAAGNIYQLVSLDELWRHRAEILAGEAFGTLDDQADPNSPTLKDLPWNWQYKGIHWLSDPAGLFRLLSGSKAPSGSYIYNPYTE